jgi:hypothetical protein
MTVGLGSGSTVACLVEVLAQARPDACFVAASPATAAAAQQHRLPLFTLDAVGDLDLAIDGADQIDPSGWLCKGGGAAHTREKIIAAAARRFIVIASSDKLVDRCGRRCRSNCSRSRPQRQWQRSGRPICAPTPRPALTAARSPTTTGRSTIPVSSPAGSTSSLA